MLYIHTKHAKTNKLQSLATQSIVCSPQPFNLSSGIVVMENYLSSSFHLDMYARKHQHTCKLDIPCYASKKAKYIFKFCVTINNTSKGQHPDVTCINKKVRIVYIKMFSCFHSHLVMYIMLLLQKMHVCVHTKLK